jgi:hypothetical protein|nr:MAG TPA: hypothetical protein [Caudoviricetes sp.]
MAKLVKLVNILESKTLAYSVISFCLGMTFIVALINLAKLHIVNDMDYGKIEVEERAQELNHKYYNYYKATEELLDKKLGDDDPILETDCGSNYLDTRNSVCEYLR